MNNAPRLCLLWHAEPYEVPEEAGDSQDAFFKVSVLEEELRVMNPDLGAIQVGALDATQRSVVDHVTETVLSCATAMELPLRSFGAA
jgi:hypothetical protein